MTRIKKPRLKGSKTGAENASTSVEAPLREEKRETAASRLHDKMTLY